MRPDYRGQPRTGDVLTVLLVTGERHHAEALREVTAVLAPFGAAAGTEKTRVVHIDEGFTFLGFDIRRMRNRGTQKQSLGMLYLAHRWRVRAADDWYRFSVYQPSCSTNPSCSMPMDHVFVVPVAGMPGDVLVTHALPHLPVIGTDYVVGADVG